MRALEQEHFTRCAREFIFLACPRKTEPERRTPRAPRPPDILSSGSACADGIFRRRIHAPTKNDAHPVHRPAGLSGVTRRCAGAPKSSGHPARVSNKLAVAGHGMKSH